jgi:hypothetical protein
MLLAWLRALGEFEATVLVAYHPYSLPGFRHGGNEGILPMVS